MLKKWKFLELLETFLFLSWNIHCYRSLLKSKVDQKWSQSLSCSYCLGTYIFTYLSDIILYRWQNWIQHVKATKISFEESM